MFPNKFRSIFVAETVFPSLPTYIKCFQHEKHCFSPLGMLKQCSTVQLYCKHKQYFKIRTSYCTVSRKMFPSLPTVGNMSKHRQEQCFRAMFLSLPRA